MIRLNYAEIRQVILKRIEELRMWLPEELDWIKDSIEKYYIGSEPPYVYCNVYDGLQFEWLIDGWDMSLSIDLITHIGKFQALNFKTNADLLFILDFNDTTKWHVLSDMIMNFTAIYTKRK